MSLTRRSILSLGLSAMAAAVAEMAGERAVSADPSRPAPRAKRCVVLYMNGGPSHLDTFDPKPGTKSGGRFKAIATRAAGVRIAEHIPRVADRMDRIALVRSVSSKEGNHARAIEMAHTGRVPNPTVAAPSIGAWIAKHVAPHDLALPAFVSLGGPSRGAGFFGRVYDPFVVQEPGSLPADLTPARPVAPSREAARRELLDAIEADDAARTGDPAIAERRALYARARALMDSKAVAAFDASSEPESVRAAYGTTDFGRGCLVARRLLEAGTPFVEVTLDGWDTHKDNFDRVETLSGALDPAMSNLVQELADRSLLDTTLVVWLGEFGRTPSINADEGRDHHPAAFSVAFAGAGVRGGAVIGETDAEGGSVVKDPVSVPDVVATIASAMGLDPNTEERTSAGRPIRVTERGKPIDALFA